MAKKKMITAAETAEMTGKAIRTICAACQHGQLRAEKVGRSWMIEKTSVKEYVKALKAAERAKKAGRRS